MTNKQIYYYLQQLLSMSTFSILFLSYICIVLNAKLLSMFAKNVFCVSFFYKYWNFFNETLVFYPLTRWIQTEKDCGINIARASAMLYIFKVGKCEAD